MNNKIIEVRFDDNLPSLRKRSKTKKDSLIDIRIIVRIILHLSVFQASIVKNRVFVIIENCSSQITLKIFCQLVEVSKKNWIFKTCVQISAKLKLNDGRNIMKLIELFIEEKSFAQFFVQILVNYYVCPG